MGLPEKVVPMLATSGELPPNDGWSFEVKWDGVRLLAYCEAGTVRLETRNLIDASPRYPELQGLADALDGRPALLDGEVVAFDANGRPDFGTLQRRMHLADARSVRLQMSETPVVFCLFDVLHLDGEWLSGQAWTERRALLEGLGLGGQCWRVPAAHDDGAALLEATGAQGLEGVMAKRRAAPYLPGKRTRDWLKVKHVRRQEVVIGGWLPGEGRRSNTIGALLIGVHDERGLRFAGKVGTGFTDAELSRLQGILAPLARPATPFVDKVPYRAARFVEPTLVAEVAFTEWTVNDTMRHPSYKGLRDDKDAAEVVRE